MSVPSKLDETHDFVTLYEYSAGESFTTPPQWFTWTAISLIAACLEDRVWLMQLGEHAPLYPNVWVFLIGPPGAGKDHSVGIAKSLLEEEDPLWVIEGRVTIPALYDYMAAKQKATGRDSAPVYLISADVTEQLPVGPEALDFTSRVLALYGGRDRVMLDLTRTSGSKSVRKPLMNWISGCVEDWFPEAIKPVVFNSGFSGRAFFVLGKPQYAYFHHLRPTQRHDLDVVREFLRERVKLYQQIGGKATYTKQAEERLKRWLEEKGQDLQHAELNDAASGVVNRIRANVQKLAMISAVSQWREEYQDPLKIRNADVDRAIDWYRGVADGALSVSDYAYITMDTAPMQRLEQTVRMAGEITRSKLLKIMLKRGVKNAKHLDDLVDSLKQSGQLTVERRPPRPGGGPRPVIVKWKKRQIQLAAASGDEENTDAAREDQDGE